MEKQGLFAILKAGFYRWLSQYDETRLEWRIWVSGILHPFQTASRRKIEASMKAKFENKLEASKYQAAFKHNMVQTLNGLGPDATSTPWVDVAGSETAVNETGGWRGPGDNAFPVLPKKP